MESNRNPPCPHSPPAKISEYSEEEELMEYYNLPAQDTSRLPAHNCLHRSNSMERQSTVTDKTKSLEKRLKGATGSIRHLEKVVKEKDAYIQKLEDEIKEKSKALETFQSQYALSQNYMKSTSAHNSIASVMRKKEKQLQELVKKQQEKIEEDKKSILRVQELNKNLVKTLKEKEQESKLLQSSSQEKQKSYSTYKIVQGENESLSLEIRGLHRKIDVLTQEASEWEQKYNNLLAYSIDFEEKSRSLYRANELLNENIFKLLDS